MRGLPRSVARPLEKTLPATALLAALLAGCGPAKLEGSRPPPDPRPEVYSGPLRIGPATTSWFEPERLPGVDTWMCGGLVDLDGDERLEVLLVSPARLRVFTRTGGGWSIRDEPLPPLAPIGGDDAMGCAAADLNGDGRVDLAVAAGNEGFVLWNDPGGSFRVSPLPAFPSVLAGEYVAGISAIDADGDGRLDLYVARGGRAPQQFERDGCAPTENGGFLCGLSQDYLGGGNFFLRNDGGEHFTPIVDSGAEDARMTWIGGVVDVNDDGRQDLLSCNDGARNGLYINWGAWVFRDEAAGRGLGFRNHCMGVAFGDLDGDGRTDLALADVWLPSILLAHEGRFVRAGRERGINPSRMWAWGTEMEDFDNDGDLDLLFTNTLVCPSYWEKSCGSSCDYAALPEEEILLFRNSGEGYFRAESPVSLPPNRVPPDELNCGGSEALVVADVDEDGVLDALVLRFAGLDSEGWLLWGRTAQRRSWVEVAAPQGTKVEVCAGSWCQRREVAGAHSFAAMHPTRLHFGLAGARGAVVHTVRPGEAQPQTWTAAAGSRLIVGALRPAQPQGRP